MLKKIAIVIVVLLVLFGGALFFALQNVESIVGRYKPQIEQMVSDKLETQVSLGDLEVSVWPQTRVAVNQVEIGEASNRDFQLEQMVVQVNLLPAIRGVIEVSEITLIGLDVKVQKDKEQITIRGLPKQKKSKDAPSQPEAETAESTSEQSGPPPIEFNLNSFQIKNARISYSDLESNTSYQISSLNLESGLQIDSEKVLMPSLSLSGELEGVTPFSVTVDSFSYGLQDKKVELSNTKFELLEGDGKTQFTLDSGTELQPFQSLIKVSGLNLGQLFSGLAPDSPLTVNATLKSFSSQIKGGLGAPDLKASLNGSSSFQVVDGEIQGLGLAQAVLSQLSELPFIQESLKDELPEEEQRKVESDTTSIRNMSADLNIADNMLSTENFILESDLFDLEGRGQVSLNADFDLTTTLAFHPAISQAFVKKVNELEALLDDRERLIVPVRLRGKPGNISVSPDLNKLMQGALGKKVEKEAGRLLERALGGKKDDQGADSKKDSGLRGVLGF